MFLNAAWTGDLLTAPYEMRFNQEKGYYEGEQWLKLGYYSYQYLWQHDDGTVSPVPSEGNFFQTVNEYTVLQYYRAPAGRTDRLIGYATVSTDNRQ